MVLKALIVDDEYPARKELRYLLENYENVQVVGEATNAQEAMLLINALDYTILFLDIDMPGCSGLELSKKLKGRSDSPFVIFVTAHEEFALEAFGVDAVDYLLKPVDPKRLDRALEKVFQMLPLKNGRSAAKIEKEEPRSLGLIPVEHKGKTLLLDEEEIVFIHASNDYTYIKTQKEKYLTRFTLKELEKRLDSRVFYRCHRSYVVNIKKTREVTPLYNGTLILVVDDNEKSEVPVSRNQAKKMRQLLGM